MKKNYEKPDLKQIGSLIEITTGGGSGVIDGLGELDTGGGS